MAAAMELAAFVGREPERFTIDEQKALAGKWMALEVYTPATLPLRRIQAVGSTQAECIAQLVARGLNPRNFEFTVIDPPF